MTQTTISGRVFVGMDLAKRVPWWKWLAAKVFGQRLIGRDNNVVVVMRVWNGCYYIEEVINDYATNSPML